MEKSSPKVFAIPGLASFAMSLWMIGCSTVSTPIERTPNRAVITKVNGQATFDDGIGGSGRVTRGMNFGEGTSISTLGDSTVDLEINGQAFKLRLECTVQIGLISKDTVGNAGAQLVITKGGIDGNITKLSKPFEVRTTNGLAQIRDAQFKMYADGMLVVIRGTATMTCFTVGVASPPTEVTAGFALFPPSHPGGTPLVFAIPSMTQIVGCPLVPGPPTGIPTNFHPR